MRAALNCSGIYAALLRIKIYVKQKFKCSESAPQFKYLNISGAILRQFIGYAKILTVSCFKKTVPAAKIFIECNTK